MLCLSLSGADNRNQICFVVGECVAAFRREHLYQCTNLVKNPTISVDFPPAPPQGLRYTFLCSASHAFKLSLSNILIPVNDSASLLARSITC